MTTVSAARGNLVAVTLGTSRVQLHNHGNHQSTLTYSKSDASIRKLLFCGTEYLCGLLDGDEGIVVWSITRGVVISTMKENSILDIASHEEQETLFVLVANKEIKLYVQEYIIEPKNLKLVRKIKAGKIEDGGTTGLAVSKENTMAVRNGTSLKVFQRESGEKLFKCKLGAVSGGKSWLGLSDKYVIACTPSQVQIFSTNANEKLLSSVVVSEEPTQLALQGDILMVDTSLYEISNKKKVLSPAVTLDEAEDNCSIRILFAGNSDLNAVIQTPGCPVEVAKLKFVDEDGKILERLALPSKEDEVPADGSTKRPASSINTTLGAGQAGQESLNVTDRPTKKSKPSAEDAEEEDPTIALRLQRLQQILDQEDKKVEGKHGKSDFLPKKATTESLSHLLHQALSSSDDSILELALAVKDATIRQTSVDDLTGEEATEFLNKLTSRMSRKPTRAGALVPWITTLLQSGKITTVAPLIPLKNLVNERVEVFPQLLQLDGRLSLLTNMQ
mmetsp:Transcript_7371/g.10756  ORF Transcript_7371/g.10756 Transcript_7371/m.10756 type:complete len:503 (-) Transcript_7371:102-1610(-)